jgi:hypothetical protein
MKKEKLILILLAVVLGFLCGRTYMDQFTYVNEVRYKKNVETLDLSGQTIANLEELKAFSGLKTLDLRETGITAGQYDSVKSWFADTEILWDIPFQGEFYPMDTEELTISALTEADIEALSYFPELKRISAEDCPDYVQLHNLRMARQDLSLRYRIPACGEAYSYDTAHLVLPGADVAALAEVLPYFTGLKSLELTAPLAPAQQVLELAETVPQVDVSWNLMLGGIPVDRTTETLDLTGIPMTVEEMDAVLPYLSSLTYVDMTDCGISNEEMDALDSRYENVKIVWTVTLGKGYRIRTDATHFMPVLDNYYPTGNELDNLRYCHDIIAIDVGHRKVTNCEFAAYMPHLQYLLLADTAVRDLTPLTGLKELKYLELFQNNINDFSPLVTLTALEDLNLHYTHGDPKIIAQITWLKNLWWNNIPGRKLTAEDIAMLQEAMPECNINYIAGSSTGGGWRELPNYYAQRDIFGTYYMTG